MVHFAEILNNLLVGNSFTDTQLQQLIEIELANESKAIAFGVTPENVSAVIKERSRLFCLVYPSLLQAIEYKFTQQNIVELLWNLWLPLALQLAKYRQGMQRPLIQGILGGQGTGKSTLAAILSLILEQLGYRTLSLSLDDLYKTYTERLTLQAQDPRIIWRGPPGTHDVTLGIEVLDQLRSANPKLISVPRFDKSAWEGLGDRTEPEIVQKVDIVLFEGWFVGVRSISTEQFENAPPPIITSEDKAFAHEMNIRLAEYLPLWERLDKLILLYPVDYQLCQKWRLQAENEMIASGKSGMTNLMVKKFVEYFWKALHPELFIKPLTQNSKVVDIVIEINSDRSLGKIYQPSDI